MHDDSWASFALSGNPMEYLKYKQRGGYAPSAAQAKDFTSEANQGTRPRSS